MFFGLLCECRGEVGVKNRGEVLEGVGVGGEIKCNDRRMVFYSDKRKIRSF